jgi:hypothetical protein
MELLDLAKWTSRHNTDRACRQEDMLEEVEDITETGL